jgi:hypothetical protein
MTRKLLEAVQRQLNECLISVLFVISEQMLGIALFLLFCAPVCAYLVCNLILYSTLLCFLLLCDTFWLMHADLGYFVLFSLFLFDIFCG